MLVLIPMPMLVPMQVLVLVVLELLDSTAVESAEAAEAVEVDVHCRSLLAGSDAAAAGADPLCS